jgi:hypothetical protein
MSLVDRDGRRTMALGQLCSAMLSVRFPDRAERGPVPDMADTLPVRFWLAGLLSGPVRSVLLHPRL